MKRSFFPALAVAFAIGSNAQVTLFSEDFEGASPAFTLNTTDAGSAISAWNTWVINSSYTGGTGDVICLGFPFSYTIVDTPTQPGGISSANGNYLHTASVEGIADGITCCSFGAADGLCITASNTFSRMTSDVSTVGYTDVDFTFWWVCEGGATYYGQVYYSTDGGSSWTATTTPAQYNLQGSWTQQTLNLPAFAGQATLRFGFRFVNSVSLGGALDPGFAMDDVAIIGQTGAGNSITCSTSPNPACAGSSLTVSCTATGTFNPGNVFTAELSDALGSFASPVVIGSIAATTSTSFGATIPAGTPAGTGYLVRVSGSNPVVTGTPGAAFTVVEGPDAGLDGTITVCTSGATINMFMGIVGSPDPGGAWTDPLGNAFSGFFTPGVSIPGCYVYTVPGAPPCSNDQSTHCITAVIAPDAGVSTAATVCEGDPTFALFAALGGTPDTGGTWTLPGGAPGSGIFTPGTSPPGCYTYTVPGIAPCTSSTATVCVTVVPGPNAGSDTAIGICKATGLYNLFNYLGGSPDAGGSWIGPGGGASSGVFNSNIDLSGDYAYSVPGSGACDTATAVVSVTLVSQANAGNGLAAAICSNVLSVPLIGLLGGSPDVTGTWFNPGGFVTDPNFDPSIDAPGDYTYVVYGAPPCPNDSATISISVQTAPNAGNNGTFTICNTDPLTDLFPLITGSPDAGGTWTDPGGNPSTGIVDPATAPSGLYTYTVSGAPACADDVALLAIVFDPCSGMAETGEGSLAWLGQQPDGAHLFSIDAGELGRMSVFDALGRSLDATVQRSAHRFSLDLGAARTGVYFVKVDRSGTAVIIRIAHVARH